MSGASADALKEHRNTVSPWNAWGDLEIKLSDKANPKAIPKRAKRVGDLFTFHGSLKSPYSHVDAMLAFTFESLENPFTLDQGHVEYVICDGRLLWVNDDYRPK